MFGRKPMVVLLALAATFAARGVLAQDAAKQEQSAGGCAGFSWPVTRERAWFDDARLPRRATGARLKRIDRAVALDLKPTREVQLFLPPVRRPRTDSFSGEVTFFGVPRPGRYQVTLSDDASIDVFENGAWLQAIDSTSGKTCGGVSKSERFVLAPGDLVLVEVTDAPARSIKIAFSASP